MTTVSRKALVPYTPAEMYALVNDIEAYPSFLPWCKEAVVMSRTEDEVKATLTIAKAGLEKSFSTVNRLQPDKMMEMRLLNGPFKQLHGFWRFADVGGKACRVMFDCEFELAGRFLDRAFSKVFTQVASTLVANFCRRAIDIYGERELD